MMDSQQGGGPPLPPVGGLFGGAGGIGGRAPGSAQLSPYLNIDPSYLNAQTPEFISNQDQKRGRMEKSFTAIGSSVLTGAAVGGLYGLYDGVRHTAALRGRLRRTQVLNYTMKSGATASNSLGAIAVVYSSIYCLASLAWEDDHEMKSVLTGGLTGALYKSSAGLRKCAVGSGFGAVLAAVWAYGLRKDERVSNYV